jgi:hypothetical protein
MKILVSYRAIPQSPGWATGDCVVRAFQALGHDVTPYGNYYQTQKRLEDCNVLADDWDLFLFLECGDGDPVYTELANIRARKRASWFFDAALYPQHWLAILRLFEFDVNFIANSTMLYDNLNTEYLPYAADPALHYRSYKEKTRDFLLIGSDRPERRRLYDLMKRACPDARIDFIHGVFREAYIDALASSHYVINDVAGGGAGLLPMRCTETMAAGSVLLSVQDPALPTIGTNLEHYINFRDENHLFGTEVNGTNHFHHMFACGESFSKRIALTGQQHCLEHHTYRNRCQAILQRLFPYET